MQITTIESKKTLSELQQRLLTMFEWFHRFCEEHHLRYYMLGGTMLGASRHQGFIPWDDDIDVGMPRDDYEMFCQYSKRLFEDQYIIEIPSADNPEFQYLFAKVYDTKTTMIEHTRLPIERGIYLDVFPLDGIGETMDEALKNYKPVHRWIQMHCSAVCAFRKGRAWYKNASIILGRVISPMLLKERTLNKKIEKLSKKHPFDKCTIIGNLYGAWGVREIMPKSCLGTPTLYQFENIAVFGVEHPDDYLRSLYGNWRDLPPIEKRRTHHDFILCDLQKPYLQEGKER